MINEFRGEYRWLSNFWPAEVEVIDGIYAPTVEHGYQASKAADWDDFQDILDAKTPGQAKRMARQIIVRDNWEEVKLSVMYFLVLEKFTEHRELRDKLLATGTEEIMEGNTWGDTFWGVCNGVGQNHLGNIIMEIREVLRSLDGNEDGGSK